MPWNHQRSSSILSCGNPYGQDGLQSSSKGQGKKGGGTIRPKQHGRLEILERTKACLEVETDHYGRKNYWLSLPSFQIEVLPQQEFEAPGRKTSCSSCIPRSKDMLYNRRHSLAWRRNPCRHGRSRVPSGTATLAFARRRIKSQKICQKLKYFEARPKPVSFCTTTEPQTLETIDLSKVPFVDCKVGPIRTTTQKKKHRIASVLEQNFSIGVAQVPRTRFFTDGAYEIQFFGPSMVSSYDVFWNKL